MSTPELTTVITAQTSSEATQVVDRLRDAGLHPADVSLSATLPTLETARAFPVKVPVQEIFAARKLLKPVNSPDTSGKTGATS